MPDCFRISRPDRVYHVAHEGLDLLWRSAYESLGFQHGIQVEGANSVLLTPDKRLLFAVNGGDNSVSSFDVAEDGKLTLLDVKRTGNPVTGKSGTAKTFRSRQARSLWRLGATRPTRICFRSSAPASRFTAADISVGYALLLAQNIGLSRDFTPGVAAYWQRLQARDGFRRAIEAEKIAGEQQKVAPGN